MRPCSASINSRKPSRLETEKLILKEVAERDPFQTYGGFLEADPVYGTGKGAVRLGDLNKYGRAGVAALSSATPVDSGETAASWYYEITNKNNTITISFHNSNIQMESPSPSFSNTGMARGPEAGYREEITSTLRSSLFLTR